MRSKFKNALVLIMTASLLTSCATFIGKDIRRGSSSSLVDYLYPDGKVPPKHQQSIPHLQLPLTVGLAFVPSRNSYTSVLPEARKSQLLENVKQKFAGLDYVKDIVVVPETYMRSSKGFDGVGQIARLYGLDIVALVSYDQVSVTAEKKSSLLYWTIAGAYVIKGNQNKATTFVDTAVFDVNSRKMLFRAPGVSEIKKSSTLIEVRRTDREIRDLGFEVAIKDMSNNLSVELGRFKERIKVDKNVQVSYKQGYSGSGSVQLSFLLIVVLMGMAIRRSSKKSKRVVAISKY